MGTGARKTVKSVALAIATIGVIPALCSYHVRSWIFGRDRAFEGSTQRLARLSGVLGQYLRRAFLMRTLDHCASSATIEYGTIFASTRTRIDEFVYIGPYCCIGQAHFERDVLVAAAVHVTSGGRTHGIGDLDTPIREQPGAHRRVRIGAGSWIGSAAGIMADVGRNSVGGAVVTSPIPDRVVAAGVPARVIRGRDGQVQPDATPAGPR